jgi:N5-(cytidine 5'-diphosphoramidyl)-L-glutamine hydrolase
VKAVGVTQRVLPPDGLGEVRNALDVRWTHFLAACGLLAVPLPNSPGLAVRTAEELDLAAVVLSGGDDLVPYGGSAPARDDTERELLRWALAGDVPVLGVCRGMQAVLDHFGTLLRPVAGHVAVRHEVEFRSGGRREVNSYHRLAATTVADPLVVDAVCGPVVEQVRHRDARLVGVMWHPEREPDVVPDDIALVRDLLRTSS